MGPDGTQVIAWLQRRLEQGQPIDMPTVVRELRQQHIPLAEAFAEVLEDRSAFEWHYYAMAGMRTLAEDDSLPPPQVLSLLDVTRHFAWRMGTDEFYKSIDAIACSQLAVPVLLSFVSDQLLGQRNVPEWRWLAFTAVGAVSYNHTAIISQALINRLRDEINALEPWRQQQAAECLSGIEAAQS